ncbi:S8 family serine peptidase [Aquabacterium sp. A7-Y]|uniref:S8 family serine peptidase n=1 Tax=Aquabacterium sp. A7-Y TaxID=1349605 RepID=UPI00223CAABE|nr:S8 family serine peptidase [Aquabacterium sp. A7-Y]MCW7541059.1 S8 family serine peptidase [Aquabacterium sp. A7-Y]
MRWLQTTLALALSVAAWQAGAQQAARKPYIVQLADAPAAAYNGTVGGHAATRPAPGARFDIQATGVRSYLDHLEARRQQALSLVAGAPVLHRYSVAFNGFSALLSDAEVQKLKASRVVVAVTADLPRKPDTSRTPVFLGLATPGGLWSQTDAAARPLRGEDVIIGIVDTGIWPENPSFADAPGGAWAYGPPPARWRGSCQAGPGFTRAFCNDKLIGAQFFDLSFRATGLALHWRDWPSPRDQDGHGSHTASTAGGNAGVDTVINGVPAGSISGMAPRARIAAYKACWAVADPATGEPDINCWTGDSVAAIDQAVADGVDVINFSISGTRSSFLDPVEVAFLNAAAAGVFVAASAGNDGPANTVAHMSPWLTTVAASTHDRLSVATLTLGNGTSYRGPSLSRGLPKRALVLSTAVALKPPFDDSNTDARLCFAGSLDPARAAGRIVVCDRGTNARVEKSEEVLRAGGAGMVLLNPASGDLIDDAHFVPTVHLPDSVRDAVRSYAASAGATASLSHAAQASDVVAPVMADFSSRGPNLANANLLKPDLTAPGVSVLAAHAWQPETQAEHDAVAAGTLKPPAAATFLSGTSMSSPHVAGIAALLKQRHPGWSPAALKSALLTSTGGVRLAEGSTDADVWGYGAGHVRPSAAAATTLVYDAGLPDYLRFLCGIGALAPDAPSCATHGAAPPYDLNLPSIAAEVVGRVRVRRSVTHLGTSQASYVASASLPGFSVQVEPARLTLQPGQSASFSVWLSRSGAPLRDWRFGELVWSDGGQPVRSPIAARALALSVPRQIEDTRPAGTQVFTVGSGFAGRLAATPIGLEPARQQRGSVAAGGSTCFPVVVNSGALYARFALFDEDTSGGGKDDLDLEVYLNGALVGASAGATASEEVTLERPVSGSYSACVLGFAPQGGQAGFTLSDWVLVPRAAGQAPGSLRAVSPSRVELGGTASVGLGWSVAAGRRYLGAVVFSDGAGSEVGQSLVFVDSHGAAAGRAVAAGRKAVTPSGR